MAQASQDIAAKYGAKVSGGTVNGSPVYKIPAVCHGSTSGNRSLKIWDGEGGSIGARCHSQDCAYQTILTALGIDHAYEGRRHSDAKGRIVLRRRGPGKDLTGNSGSPKGLFVKLADTDKAGKSIVLVEGEKAFDAFNVYPSEYYTGAHWVGGTGSVGSADYSPLAGRHVILFPDNDAVGFTAMKKAAICCAHVGVASLKMIPLSALAACEVPEHGDAADLMGAEIAALLEMAEVYSPPDPMADAGGLLTEGGAVDRHAGGWLLALRSAGLELRGNTRSGQAEVRHVDHGNPEALALEKAAGLDPDPTGWAVFDTKAQEYIRDVWARKFRYDNGKPCRVSQEHFQSWMSANLAGRMIDPVQLWIKGLPPWDGTERIPKMFTDALGAADTPLNSAAATAFMVGGIRRTYNPGCQHDWAPVLIGGQGAGKSTFCRYLVPDGHDNWYSAIGSLAAEVQKQVEQIGSALVVEFKEMRGAAAYQVVKSYLDTGADTFRPPYGRTSERHKRAWVGIGTGNDEGEGVLPDDPTGNRRYVAIPVATPGTSQEDRAEHVRRYLSDNRTQLWAEALARYNRSEKSYIGAEYETMRDTQNVTYTRSNQPLEDVAQRLTDSYANSKEPLSLAQLMIEGDMAINTADAVAKAPSVGKQLASLLVKLQWESRRKRGATGRLGRVWFPPMTVAVSAVACMDCGGPVRPDHNAPANGLPTVRCAECCEAALVHAG